MKQGHLGTTQQLEGGGEQSPEGLGGGGKCGWVSVGDVNVGDTLQDLSKPAYTANFCTHECTHVDVSTDVPHDKTPPTLYLARHRHVSWAVAGELCHEEAASDLSAFRGIFQQLHDEW